jgi:hypothetical protein
MIWVGRSLVLAAWVVVAVCGADAAFDRPVFEIEAPSGFEAVAREIETMGRRSFGGALSVTGLVGFSAPITIVVAQPGSPVAERTPEWISGFADGRTRAIVLFPDRVSRYPDGNLKTLVVHEVAHVLVAEAARGRSVPRWFNEGVATVAAREWGIEDRARYAAAVVGRGPRTVDELDLAFARGGSRVSRAYALSGAFVRWLRSEYGDQVTAVILDLLGRDMSFREAFVRATGDTLEWAEHRFFVREALWHTWVPFLTSSGVLWAGITALALIAIQRRRLKSAAMRDRWEAEEVRFGASPAAGSPEVVDDLRKSAVDDVGDDDVVN